MSERILFVDDDAGVREALSFSLEEQGFDVTCADSGEAALDETAKASFDVVLTDLRMPGMSGIDLVRELSVRAPQLPCVVITAHGSVDAAVEAMRLGASDFLQKPISRDVLRITLERVLRSSRLARENATLRDRLDQLHVDDDGIVASSAAMRAVLDVVDRVADTDATVLLTGESGTGKEMVARRLHERSHRRDRPFVALNCSALPRELLESELFGHEKGAFTGATRSRRGRFVEAQGGTLFLDEIGDMDLDLQSKLLRALQERQVDVVGGGSVEVDVRVLAATHRDLSARVASGAFREDLFFRLHVLPIQLPPLRARRGDVPLLFRHLLARAAEVAGREVPEVDAELLAGLEERPWPGNVRELSNVATRLLLTGDGQRLSAAALQDSDGRGVGGATARADGEATEDASAGVGVRDGLLHLPEEGVSLEALERAAVIAALSVSGGNRTRAAKFLRVPRHVLLYRMEKYGIDDDEVRACDGAAAAPLRAVAEEDVA
jgi:two-component system NtrC family response regulator